MSGYPHNSLKYNPSNKGKLGTLKDEFPKKQIIKFVCLRSKCYIVEMIDGTVNIKNKGVRDNSLTIEDYENVLNKSINEKISKQCSIRSFNHQVYTIEFDKVCLSGKKDLKRNEFININKMNFDIYESKALGYIPNNII